MALHELSQTFSNARAVEAPRTVDLSLKSDTTPGPTQVPGALVQTRQLLTVLGGTGLAALGLLAVLCFGSTPVEPEAVAFCLGAAALSLVSCLWMCRRSLDRAEAARLAITRHAQGVEAAGALGLRWDLVTGDLVWSGYAGGIFSTGESRPPSFRDLRHWLHPDDFLYASISQALKSGQKRVNWPVRIKDAEKGWRTFQLRGEISSTPQGAPAFEGLLVPIDPSQSPQGLEGFPSLPDIVESLPISIAIWDRENRLVLCNRKFRQLYRVSAAAALPGTSYEAIQAQTQEAIAQRPPEGRGVVGRFQLQERQLGDGTWLQIGEYWTGEGTLVSFGTDITMQKQTQHRVLEREQQMRARVDGFEQSRRQLEIQARQLRELAESYNEEKIRAEAANQAKSEFLANVSHELRTPLNAIIGFSEMMRDGVLGPIGNPKYESYVKDIHNSGRYLLEMINDILDMSKIEAGRWTLSPEWFTMSDVFQECLSVVSPVAMEGSVELSQSGNTGISLYGDRRALKQVLINLLSNAVKFTPQGGRVSLRAYRYRGSIRIAIADTGVGIPKHDLGRLGRPFEQVSNQLTKGHKGTGLGLAISRSLVEMHGGKLDIKSRVGEGTTVTCILPVQDEKDIVGREAA
ncbi:PAS-domain containing protein [Rhodomicrobium vannielii ATCC 17100]|uniref:sensor histidine kinase n=1 Tax=Rhodomicrobium vannielii TaxID=1069 RepID=UPI0019194B38|nr:PAS domain-containing sensor histidine kinase [Rhodomicrobium vannielii]MBJ7533851.1 PAS-domain containing protein [Rhodomicrobium vannielii ATCC 17100]